MSDNLLRAQDLQGFIAGPTVASDHRGKTITYVYARAICQMFQDESWRWAMQGSHHAREVEPSDALLVEDACGEFW